MVGINRTTPQELPNAGEDLGIEVDRDDHDLIAQEPLDRNSDPLSEDELSGGGCVEDEQSRLYPVDRVAHRADNGSGFARL